MWRGGELECAAREVAYRRVPLGASDATDSEGWRALESSSGMFCIQIVYEMPIMN